MLDTEGGMKMLMIQKQMSIQLADREWAQLESRAKKEGSYRNRQASWLIREALKADEKTTDDDFDKED